MLLLVCGPFGAAERLNKLETSDTLFEADLLKKAEQTPKISIFMLLEESFQIEKLGRTRKQCPTKLKN